MEQIIEDVQHALNDDPLIRADGGMTQQTIDPQDEASIIGIAAPEEAVPGDTFNVEVDVQCLAPSFTNCEIAVELVAEGINRRVPVSNFRDVFDEEFSTFSFGSIEMPDQTISITARALEDTPTGGVVVDDTAQFTIQAVTEQEQRLNTIERAAPWVIGGTSIGFGGGAFSDRPPSPLAGAALGAGSGSLAFVLQDQLVFPDITFPTGPVLATAGLLGGAALLLSQSQDAQEIVRDVV